MHAVPATCCSTRERVPHVCVYVEAVHGLGDALHEMPVRPMRGLGGVPETRHCHAFAQPVTLGWVCRATRGMLCVCPMQLKCFAR